MIKNRLIIKNASVFNNEKLDFVVKNICLENGKVTKIADRLDEGKQPCVDLMGKMLLKPFCDYHLHLPGAALFDLYGINMTQCNSMEQYKNQIIKKIDNIEGAALGFGWTKDVLDEYFSSQQEDPLSVLDAICSTKPLFLFSADFHSCWCNSKALAIIEEERIQYVFVEKNSRGSIFHVNAKSSKTLC